MSEGLIYPVARTTKPPVIDGRMEAPEWPWTAWGSTGGAPWHLECGGRLLLQ